MSEDEKPFPRPIGLIAVIEKLRLQTPLPAVRSSVISGARRTRVDHDVVYEGYPKNYATGGLYEDLKFAMRYEPIDLGVLKAAFEQIHATDIALWIGQETTSMYARKIWYLYELLTGKTLDLPDVAPTGYVDLLNPKLQLTGMTVRVRRQRINDNLLGNAEYCPLVRVTDRLVEAMGKGLGKEAQKIVDSTDPLLLARVVSYLYTRETKSSFAIEGEKAGETRAERFVASLERAADFNIANKAAFVALQNQIVDPRFAADNWRDIQNYVGQTMRDYSEQVHFVCPKPEDVPELMEGWMACASRLQSSSTDPVATAAAMAFGFVFIHPFEDGNGRIHRFLIHHELARSGFAPQKFIFPVSVVMLRERANYDRVLESYSKSILPFIEYSLDDHGIMTVSSKTNHLYRYWDATKFAEYLYDCIAETVRRDLHDELSFLRIFDQALSAVLNIVDLPDRRASLLVKLILQNRGTLSGSKREKLFAELTDEEITAMEAAIAVIIEDIEI